MKTVILNWETTSAEARAQSLFPLFLTLILIFIHILVYLLYKVHNAIGIISSYANINFSGIFFHLIYMWPNHVNLLTICEEISSSVDLPMPYKLSLSIWSWIWYLYFMLPSCIGCRMLKRCFNSSGREFKRWAITQSNSGKK